MRIPLFAVLLGLFLLFPNSALASYFHLSPQNQQVEEDSTFQLEVKLNTENEVINGVSAYLAFPPDKLDVVSIQGNSENFPIQAEEDVQGNVIKISRANLSSLNGDVGVATINFRAKGTGTAQVQFIPGSAVPRTIDSQETLNLTSSLGGSYQITEKTRDADSTPRPNQSERRIIRCQEKEAANKSSLNSIIDTFNSIKSSIDTIFVLVDEYYASLGRTIPTYSSQKQEVEGKRTQALTNLEKLKNDSQNFNCNLTNPREKLKEIKTQAHSTKDSFESYAEAVKKLIEILRSNS